MMQTSTPPADGPAVTLSHSSRTRRRRIGHRGMLVLDRMDTLVYVIVGACFFLAALLSLAYAIVKFGTTLILLAGTQPQQIGTSSSTPQSIVNFVSDLLLTLIVMEVLGTVVHYLRTRETSLRPFLFIGIISATRSILAVGARLSISENGVLPPTEFRNSMVELGVNAAVIIALGITMRLIGNFLDDSFDITRDDHQAADGSHAAPEAACGLRDGIPFSGEF